MNNQNPYVFIVGCPRSGTTLLQRMLDVHPNLAVANDTHFITRAAKNQLKVETNPALTSALVNQVIRYRRFHRMGLTEGESRQAASDCSTYGEFVARLYDLRAQKRGKPLSGEKTPDYCRQIAQLHGLFPKAKFIHIIRDGRNTALSTLNWATTKKGPGKWGLWKIDPIATCALWWHWQVMLGVRNGRSLAQGYYREILYEELVADPISNLRNIAEFIDISYSDAMAKYHTGKTRKSRRLSAKSAWLPPTPGLRDWQAQMNKEDLQVFEGTAGDTLSSLGYAPSDEVISPAARRRIQRGVKWWKNQKMNRDLAVLTAPFTQN